MDFSEAVQIVEAIKKIVLDYEIISKNCVKYVGKFDWYEIDKKYVNIYKQIVK